MVFEKLEFLVSAETKITTSVPNLCGHPVCNSSSASECTSTCITKVQLLNPHLHRTAKRGNRKIAKISKESGYFLTYSIGNNSLPSYEAIYVIPPMFEGLNLRSSSMDFQVMGLIWKLITWSLISQEFVKLSSSVTENWVNKEIASMPILLYELIGPVNKNWSDKVSSLSDFSFTELLSFTNSWEIKDQAISFQMSPITWKSIEELRRFKPSNIGGIT